MAQGHALQFGIPTSHRTRVDHAATVMNRPGPPMCSAHGGAWSRLIFRLKGCLLVFDFALKVQLCLVVLFADGRSWRAPLLYRTNLLPHPLLILPRQKGGCHFVGTLLTGNTCARGATHKNVSVFAGNEFGWIRLA